MSSELKTNRLAGNASNIRQIFNLKSPYVSKAAMKSEQLHSDLYFWNLCRVLLGLLYKRYSTYSQNGQALL